MKKTYTVSERKMAGVYSDTITKIMRENKNVVELEADLGGCIMGSKMDEIDQYPGQLVNCGIQEANMVGVSMWYVCSRENPVCTFVCTVYI